MKGYLLLANGQLYEGTLMGAAKPVMAELVFTTAMTGYLETLTDPSYEGEIVIQTFPTIGNYGVIPRISSGNSAMSRATFAAKASSMITSKRRAFPA